MSGIYWLASYPKSGNTWFRFFLYNFLRNGDKPTDINDSYLGRFASDRYWIDEVLGFDSAELSETEVEMLRPEVCRWSLRSEETGYYGIHDAYMPNGTPLVSREATNGVVYIIRNPLDVAVSLAHYRTCPVDRAIEIMGSPSVGFMSKNKRLFLKVRHRVMSWSENVASWVDAHDLRVEVLRYEDMKTDPVETFSRAIGFLGLPVDLGRIENAIRFSEFTQLKAQESERGFWGRPTRASSFFRKGQIGDWKNALSDAQVRTVIADHGEIMRRFGYIDAHGRVPE